MCCSAEGNLLQRPAIHAVELADTLGDYGEVSVVEPHVPVDDVDGVGGECLGTDGKGESSAEDDDCEGRYTGDSQEGHRESFGIRWLSILGVADHKALG